MRWIALAVLTLLVAACGDSGPTDNPPAVFSVLISGGPALSLIAGSTHQLSVTVHDAAGNALSGRPVSWSSSELSIATVSAGGLVTTLGPGAAQIRATSEGKMAEVALTVTPRPWTETGSMAVGRTLHAVTLLANGKVLVVGGQNVSPPFQTFASAELYDPSTGTWAMTGSLATARENPLIVRLPNGRVLVAGGYSIEQQAALASAELYDPTSGGWSSTGSMATARNLPGAVLLSDGTVLVSGGSGLGTNLQALASAEIYDPATGTWSSAGTMSVARAGHSATLLGSSRALVAGGFTGTFANPVAHNSAEIYDPATGNWTAAGRFVIPRGFHQGIPLPSGRVIIAGGSNLFSQFYGSSDLYNPTTGTWTSTGSLATSRISHTATLLPGGRVVVAGGVSNSPGVLGSVEVYDSGTGIWSPGGALRIPRSNHRAVLLANGKLLVVGGQGEGASTSAELFDPAIAF